MEEKYNHKISNEFKKSVLDFKNYLETFQTKLNSYRSSLSGNNKDMSILENHDDWILSELDVKLFEIINEINYKWEIE